MAGRTRLRALVLTALAVVLAGCADDPQPEKPTSQEPTDPGTGQTVEPTDAPLEWRPTGHPTEQRVVMGTTWSAVVAPGGSSVTLTDGEAETMVAAGAGRQVAEVLLDDAWAVLVMQDRTEQRPSRAVTVDLATGEQRDVVTPEPANGGSWAMHDGNLYYPTWGEDRAWCLATLALDDSNGEEAWCAPPRTGWSGLTASAAGVAMMTFDDARPVACRTVALLDATSRPEPLDGPDPCTAWDVAATHDGAVWSSVPRPRRQEEAQLHAVADGTTYDLGPGTTGSLLPCGDSVFYARDPQRDGDPARLLRWTPAHTLEVAYESAATGDVFIAEPACAGDVLTLTVLSERGDEQVWATVP